MGSATLIAFLARPGDAPQAHLAFPIEAQSAARAAERAPKLERLAALHSWDDQPSVRRRWRFLAERGAFDWFGAPDRIYLPFNSNFERWGYVRREVDSDGETVESEYSLDFHNGRLIEVHLPLRAITAQEKAEIMEKLRKE